MLRKYIKNIFKKKRPCFKSYPLNKEIFWNKGFAMLCDHYEFGDINFENYNNIKKGDIVWVRGDNLKIFFDHKFDQIKEPFILVSANSTLSLPKEILSTEIIEKINSPKILHWFCQNCSNITNPKISHLPLGLDFHSQYEKTSWRYKTILTPLEQEKLLLGSRNLTIENKINLVYADFHFNNSTKLLIRRDDSIKIDRKAIYKDLKNNPAVYFEKKRIPRNALWKEMAKYRFIISPHGSGLDCHRTWEALVLGSYVIVEKSALDPLYKNLPVVIVDDFKEITKDNLNIWFNQFQKEYNYNHYYQYLTYDYWINKIKEKQRSFLAI